MTDIQANIQPKTNIEKAFPDSKAVKKAVKASLKAASDAFMEQVGEGFDREQAPGGSPWVALSPKYEAWKQAHASGAKILELTGTLKSAVLGAEFQYNDSDSGEGDSVEMSGYFAVNSPVYAAVHQFGMGRIPARPFFQVEGEAEKKVIDKANDAFWKAVQR